ncbi:MAG: hypothetical protein H6Q65_102 [Firmicutes bacterium]|nr:hypothetical protein [Bacillota bacterium]
MLLYIIKAIYSFVLPPGCFVVGLLWLSRRLRRRGSSGAGAVCCLALLLYALSTGWVSGWLIGSLEDRYTVPADFAGRDVIVLLGGGSTHGTPDLDGSGQLGGSSANRMLMAARLSLKYNLPVLYTGGELYEGFGDEASIVKRNLLDLGVPEEHILLESKSLNTQQSAVLCKPILAENGFERPVIVTSAYHMERSMQIFQSVGIAAIACPADFKTNADRQFSWHRLLPSAGSLLNSATAFREYLGILALYTAYTRI